MILKLDIYMKLNAALVQENNHGISMLDAWSGQLLDCHLNALDDR